MQSIGNPPFKTNGYPQHIAIKKIIDVIIFIDDILKRPNWVTLSGPILLSLSAPLIKSYKSLAKFVPIWINKADARVNKKIIQLKCIPIYAVEDPIITGIIDADKVLGRAAWKNTWNTN